MSIDWQDTVVKTRDGMERPVERGEISVPLSHNSPNGSRIRLRFLRLRATRPNPAPPVVFLSGGPGDSGMQWASHGPFLQSFEKVCEHVDLILLDQRGSGRSEPNLTVSAPELDPDDLLNEGSMLELAKRHLGAIAAEKREDGVDLKAINVVESAKDLDSLRVALGVDTISLWGYSYGTHLTQAAAKLLGPAIERIVLCGFEGPDQTFKFPSQLDRQLERLCQFALAQGYDFLEDLRRACERLSGRPAEVEGAPFGRFAFQHLCASWCGISNRFGRLPKLARSLADGESDVLAANFKDYMRLWQRPLTFYLTDAASGASEGRWASILKEAPDGMLGNAANFPFPEIGQSLGAPDMGDEMRSPLSTRLPVLVFTGTLDGFTPTENAVEGLRTLPNGRRVLIENAAHNDLIGSPTGVDAIGEFLATGAFPNFERLTINPPKFD